jgi:hypothetical protein
MGRPLYSLRSGSARVAFAAVSGHFEEPKVVDYDAGESYPDGVDIGTAPRSIPLGHRVKAHCIAYSDTGNYFMARLTGWFVDPDGVKRAEHSWIHSVWPKPTRTFVFTEDITLDKPGVWVFHAKMEEA